MASARARLTSFGSDNRELALCADNGVPFLIFVDGMASKENPRFGDVFLLAIFCPSNDQQNDSSLIVFYFRKVDAESVFPAELCQALAKVFRVAEVVEKLKPSQPTVNKA